MTQAEVVDYIKHMTVMDARALTKRLELELGVTANAPAPVQPAVQTLEPAAEAQTEFTAFGATKINVIKVVRELTRLGLKEAKDLVERAPVDLLTGQTKDEATAVLAKIAESGASAEIV